MPVPQTGPGAPLLNMQALRAEDGSPLSVAGDLRQTVQLQSIPAVLDIYVDLLLGGFHRRGTVDMDGDAGR